MVSETLYHDFKLAHHCMIIDSFYLKLIRALLNWKKSALNFQNVKTISHQIAIKAKQSSSGNILSNVGTCEKHFYCALWCHCVLFRTCEK